MPGVGFPPCAVGMCLAALMLHVRPPQISIFVLPLIVLVGWIIGKPFTLNFDPFATIMLTLSVIHAYFVSSDGNSNWCAAVAILWALRERFYVLHSTH